MSFTAKSVIFDIADDYGAGSVLLIRSIEFKLADVLTQIQIGVDAVAYATSYLDNSVKPDFAFETSLSKIGSRFNTSWQAHPVPSGSTDQRLIIVFNTPLEFDEIVINNGHSSGVFTDRGAQNTEIHISDDAITSTVYGESIPNSNQIFDGVLTEHVAADTIDDQSPTLTPVFAGITVDVPTGTMETTGSLEVSLLPKVSDPVIQYLFILTGASDGEDDVQIPIKSWQGRLRSGDPSYLSVTIPGEEFGAAISDRSNGEMVVKMAKLDQGAIYHTEEIMRVSLEEIRLDGGGLNKSITLTGHGTASYGSKIVPLQGVTFASGSTGKLRFRASIDIFLRPGDTATHGVNSFTVDNITYTVSVDSQVMEVAE